MTDAQFKEWLFKHDSIKCLLVEINVTVNGVPQTRYLSTKNFVTEVGDTPANTAYLPVITNGFSIIEEINLDGTGSLAYGDIEIKNDGGFYDSWLNDGWTNQFVNVYMGDVRWLRPDFKRIYSGVVARIDSRSQNRLNLKLTDKLQILNAPITEIKVGGTGETKDELKPKCYGENHNIEPVCIDSIKLEYMVNNGPIERIIEVRDDGNPVPFLQDVSLGTFKLYAKPRGKITASVQGDKTGGIYTNNIAEIIKRIIKENGFTNADIDLNNFSEFAASYEQAVGIYIKERRNTLEICAELASSILANLLMNSDSKAFLFKLKMPTLPDTEVSNHLMTADSLSVLERPDIKAAFKVAYCKNWTVQENLMTGIPQQHKNLFAMEWLTTTKVNSASATANNLPIEPKEQKETLLLTEADAEGIANELVNLWSVQRTVYGYEGTPSMMLEQLGSVQKVWHTRFDFSNSRLGVVIAIKRDFEEWRAQIKVLV